MHQMTLPTGETLFYLDKFTANWVIKEVMDEDIYFQKGISINNGDTIFDVGANTGFFSYFAAKKAENLQIYTFEPVPITFDILKANMAKLSKTHKIKNYNIGLSDKAGEAEISYMPNSSGNSAFNSVDMDYKLDVMVENYHNLTPMMPPGAKFVPKFLHKPVIRLGLKKNYKSIKIRCPLQTLSEIIEENGINKINLLKLDAENHEGQVLRGIKEEDWDKIQQIAMEVHTHIKGGKNLYQELSNLLASKGFTCYEGAESLDTYMGVYMLYARRI